MAESEPIQIVLDDISSRSHTNIHHKCGSLVNVPIYNLQDEGIFGSVLVNLSDKRIKAPCQVKIELIGRIDCYNKPRKSYIFLNKKQHFGAISAKDSKSLRNTELEASLRAGAQAQFCIEDTIETFKFKFQDYRLDYETYTGGMVEIMYYLLVTVVGKDGESITCDQEVAVYIRAPPRNTNVFTIQIGVMDAVEVDLEYKKTDFHLQECITGKVLIHLALVELRKIELYLIRLESWFVAGGKSKVKEEVLSKILLKEGQPKKGDIIPLKMYLGALDLSPTMANMENRFSVKYFLTLGLIDHNERMFFRKVEINLYREQRI